MDHSSEPPPTSSLCTKPLSPSRVSIMKAYCRLWTPYAIVIGLLVAFGFLGHQSHWTFPTFSSDPKHAEEPADIAAMDIQQISDMSQGGVHVVETNNDTFSNLNAVAFTTPEGVSESGIKVELASDKPVVQEVLCSASVQYDRRRTVGLSSRVPGVVYRVTSQWGQFVKAGELLVIIEAGDVGQLKSEFARSLFDWRFRERTVERYRESSDTIPMKQLLDAEGGLKAAKVAMLSAEQALVNLGYRFMWSDFANMSEDDVMLELRTLGFDDEFKKSIEGVTASSNLLPVRAPIDGVIIGNDASIGEAVSSEKPFMEISDVSRVWVVLDVRKEDASAIRLGQSVKFIPDGSKEEVHGTLSWISTEVDEKTRTLKVRAEIENPKNSNVDSSAIDVYTLRANMFGTGRVQIRQSTGVTVRKDCLHIDGGISSLFVQTSPQVFEQRSIRRGISQGDRVEVIGDVSVGSLIAVEGSQMLKSALVLNRLRGEE